MIKGIAHLAFVVKDMNKSLDFYCNILGFKKAFELSDNDGNPWIIYIKVADGQFIELFYGGKSEDRNLAVSFNHLCLEVDNIYETVENIRIKGAVIDAEPCQGKDMNLQSWIKDPDGNRIELMQMSPESPQSMS